MLVVSLGGWVVIKWFDSSVSRLHLSLGSGSDSGRGRGSVANGTTNWVLVGTDSRAGTGNEYGGTAAVGGQRSDTTILAHVDQDGTTTMVSIPRDTYVTIPAYVDAKGKNHPAEKNKFNHAIEVGGPGLLVSTLEQLTGIPIDHYVSVDLAGFKSITNAVGGVDVCVLPSRYSSSDVNDAGTATITSSNINDPFSGWHAGPGRLHVTGDQALAFVRQRHGLPDGDINRIQRQQQFLGSVFRSATASGTLLNPARVTSLLFGVRDALSLDDGTSSADLEALAERLKGTDATKVIFETLPVRNLRESDPNVFSADRLLQLPGVGSVEVYDQAPLDRFLAPLKGLTPAPAPAPSAVPSVVPVVSVPPSRVTVQVRNGTKRPGLANSASKGLAARGFSSSISADEGTAATATVVVYSPGDKAAAQTLVAAVPGATSRANVTAPAGTLVLVLGADYTGTRAVRVAGQPAPTPSATPTPTPSAAPPPVTAASAGNRCTL